MKQLDLQVIQQAQAWLGQGRGVWLCTVLSTFGSAPRGPGAMLVALDNGEHCGSLSGGCVEDDFLERVAAGFFTPVNQVVRYGDSGLAPTMALPCGGVCLWRTQSLPVRSNLTRKIVNSVDRCATKRGDRFVHPDRASDRSRTVGRDQF